MRKVAIALISALCFVGCAPPLHLIDQSSPNRDWVVDEVPIFSDSEEARLNASLQNFNTMTGDGQALVHSTAHCEPDPFTYSMEKFEQWPLGSDEKDNGLLVAICTEPKLRVEVRTGYGLEGDISDIRAKQAIEDLFLPKARSGDIAGGTIDMVNRFTELASSGVVAQEEDGPEGGVLTSLLLLLVLAIFIWWAWAELTKPPYRGGGYGEGRHRGYGGGGSGGDGFGSWGSSGSFGGDGSFGGFGGGDSGGGGAGGSD